MNLKGAGEALGSAHGVGELFAVALVEQRLVIKQVQVRRATRHEEVDDSLRFRGEVRAAEDAVVSGLGALREKLIQSDAAEAHAEAVEKGAAVERCEVLHVI